MKTRIETPVGTPSCSPHAESDAGSTVNKGLKLYHIKELAPGTDQIKVKDGVSLTLPIIDTELV
jgi:hypothetical protein